MKLYDLNMRAMTSVARVPYKDAFLIGELLTTKMTFLTGEPKAGKSLFAAAMIRALVEGHDEFIGLPVLRKMDHVIYGYTDDGADEELRERFYGTEAEKHVSVLPLWGDVNWMDVVEGIIDHHPGLFVLDTVLGSLGSDEDISSGVTAGQVVRRLRPISEAGIPVLLVTHTPKGNAEGLTVSSSVIGGRAMAGGVRGVIALRKGRDGRRVQTSINRAKADLDLSVTVTRDTTLSRDEDCEVPVWSRVESMALRRTDWQADLVKKILDEQPNESTVTAVAARYADEVGKTRKTLENHLGRRIAWSDGTWTAKA